jgi:hypothetical protein
MSSEFQVVVRAPVIQPLDEVLLVQLGAEAKQGVTGGGCLWANVVPERRIILHRRIPVSFLESGIEVGRPHAIGVVHRRFVVEGLGNKIAEIFAKILVVFVIGQGDERCHCLRVEIVHDSRFTFSEIKGHDLPIPFWCLANEMVLFPSVAHVH